MKWIVIVAWAAMACPLWAASAPSLKLVQTIPLPGVQGRFDHFAIDTQGRRLFVAALGNNTLEVVDLALGKRLQSVTGMAKPTGVLYLSSTNQVVVANGDDGTVKILKGSDYGVLHNLAALDDADNLRRDPKTGLAWLGHGGGALGLIDTATAKVVASIKLPAHPESFQMEPDGHRLFVNLPNAKRIAVVDRPNRTVIANWPMETFQANFPMALDVANRRLFVGCRRPARLVVFDIDAGKPVADVAVSGDTDDLFYDATRKHIYLSCGEGFIDILEQRGPDAYARVSQIPTAPGARTSFFSPELDRLYLAVPERGSQKAEIRVYQPAARGPGGPSQSSDSESVPR